MVLRVAATCPQARLYTAGWSLGANILVRYLGQVRPNRIRESDTRIGHANRIRRHARCRAGPHWRTRVGFGGVVQEGGGTPLAGAVSLCNPFDLVRADVAFQTGFNRFYNHRLAEGLKKIFRK